MNLTHDPPHFNLWSAPWITVETVSGNIETVSMEHLLLNTATYHALFDPSPLVIVSIHRLLVAVLQDILQPEDEIDLIELWESDAFPPDRIHQFGNEYSNRFDIFSEDMPFLQSADIPLYPEKKGRGKSVGYLLQEQTAGTAVTHYNHTYDTNQILCAACCAKGLLTIPAFASSGGAGIKPSINGVPPIYVIPGGETYYISLVSSLVTPNFQPDIADKKNDTPWWRHDYTVGKKEELLQVGYLHSLTFPARRTRLHPEQMVQSCSRCGEMTDCGAAEMVYEMGESRPKEAAFWRDPFAAYRLKEEKAPTPIRPVEGRAVWREFTGLFLPQEQKGTYLRPSVIGQLEALREVLSYKSTAPFPFQTIGLRTDMKMKIFEWESSGFFVPPKVLSEAKMGRIIEQGLEFAAKCDSIIKSTFTQYFGGDGPNKRHNNLRNRLSQAYWEALAPDFNTFVLAVGQATDLNIPFHVWLDVVQNNAIRQFKVFADTVGSDAITLKERVQAISHNRAKIYKLRKDAYPKEEQNE